VDSLQIIANGRVVARFASPNPARFDSTVTVRVTGNTWLLARAFSAKPVLPILDLYPFASTSPVYVVVGNAPVACGTDAEYFLKWINLLSQRVRSDTNWNTSAERAQTQDLISRAHQEFIRRR
jgi:TolB protein